MWVLVGLCRAGEDDLVDMPVADFVWVVLDLVGIGWTDLAQMVLMSFHSHGL